MQVRYAVTILTGFITPFLSTAAVLLRFKGRRIRKTYLGIDDYTILAALVFTIGLSVLNLVGAFAGKMGTVSPLGPDGQVITNANQIILGGKVIWIQQWMAALAPGFTRMSVLLFYRRIFAVRNIFRVLNFVLLGLNVIWTISFFFADLLDTIPISANWALFDASEHSKGVNDKSVNMVAMLMWAVISDVVLDGLTLALPWYPVWKLRLPVATKVAVFGIFMLGSFVIVAGVFRVFAMKEALLYHKDHSYHRAPAFYWTTIEAGVGIISACLPIMRPLFSQSSTAGFSRSLRSNMSWSKLSSDRGHVPEHMISHGQDMRPNGDEFSGIYQGQGSEDHETHTSIVKGDTLEPHSVDGVLVHSTFSHTSELEDSV